jgi:hypothetical protein
LALVIVTDDTVRYEIKPFSEIRARLIDKWTLDPLGIECIARMSAQSEPTAVPFTPTISSAT